MICDDPLDVLTREPEQLNPAIILADELMRRGAAELLSVEDVANAENVLEIGAREIEAIDCHRNAFLKCPPTPFQNVPRGF